MLPARFRHRVIWSAEGSVPFHQRQPVIDERVNECLKKHPSCLPSKVNFLLARLLDVGEDLGSIVRLIESEHIPKKRGSYPKFLALSHRWGKARASLVLDSSTIEVLSNDVELAAFR
jgi:hypothetical protein